MTTNKYGGRGAIACFGAVGGAMTYSEFLPHLIHPLYTSLRSPISTPFPLKVLVPCEKCSWYKIVIMIFWWGWQSPTPPNPKSIVS
jgi:hypothetical protein